MAEKEKNEWAEKLAYAPKNGYERLSAEEEQAMHAYCEDYKDFLDHGKTERLCVEHCIELASARGFVPYEKGMALKTGDKVYYNNRGKAIMLAVIGEQDLSPVSYTHLDVDKRQAQGRRQVLRRADAVLRRGPQGRRRRAHRAHRRQRYGKIHAHQDLSLIHIYGRAVDDGGDAVERGLGVERRVVAGEAGVQRAHDGHETGYSIISTTKQLQPHWVPAS